MQNALLVIQQSNIFPELRPNTTSRKESSSDELEKRRKRTRDWNAEHIERKRANDKRWADKNHAAANRLYRKRKKEKDGKRIV